VKHQRFASLTRNKAMCARVRKHMDPGFRGGCQRMKRGHGTSALCTKPPRLLPSLTQSLLSSSFPNLLLLNTRTLTLSFAPRTSFLWTRQESYSLLHSQKHHSSVLKNNQHALCLPNFPQDRRSWCRRYLGTWIALFHLDAQRGKEPAANTLQASKETIECAEEMLGAERVQKTLE
jgi:hypothetical protein